MPETMLAALSNIRTHTLGAAESVRAREDAGVRLLLRSCSATAPRLPDADRCGWTPPGRAGDLP